MRLFTVGGLVISIDLEATQTGSGTQSSPSSETRPSLGPTERRRILRQRASEAPDGPGVYKFLDDSNRVLYVGKAKSLRKRVASYFTGKSYGRTRKMLKEASDIRWEELGHEQTALQRENHLIKELQPSYNVRLKDDKTYPFLKLTMAEKWPRLLFTREKRDDDSIYFGQYGSAKSVRVFQHAMGRIFPMRNCDDDIRDQPTRTRPCIYYDTHQCLGPCAGLANRDEYMRAVQGVRDVLEGRPKKVQVELRDRMLKAADDLRFELAAHYRDATKSLNHVVERQKAFAGILDSDFVGLGRDNGSACAQIFGVRGGQIIRESTVALENCHEVEARTLMTRVIESFYAETTEIPPEVVLQTRIDDADIVRRWLAEKRGRRVRIIVPRRGPKARMIELVARNAAQELMRMKERWMRDFGRTSAAVAELAEHLELPDAPNRIECYDVAHIQGAETTAGMVVFENGAKRPEHYRTFSIKTVEGVDDYAAMREVLARRFRRLVKDDERDKSFSRRPDFILIDGGKGQLNVAREVVGEFSLEDIWLAALAKENEEVYLMGSTSPVVLPRNSQALYLLQRIRDEAHRTARRLHHIRRHKRTRMSLLDRVDGVGKIRKSRLLRKFGSIAKIADASDDDLRSVAGMNAAVVANLREVLGRPSNRDPDPKK